MKPIMIEFHSEAEEWFITIVGKYGKTTKKLIEVDMTDEEIRWALFDLSVTVDALFEDSNGDEK